MMPKIFYTAGPGDAFQSFNEWKAGRRDLINSHVGYSRQVMDACARHDAEALITCSHHSMADQSHGGISLVYRPDLSEGKSGLGFYRSFREKAKANMRDALDFGADLVIVGEDNIPMLYEPLRRRGITVVQALHSRLWQEGRPLRIMQRLRLHDFRKSFASGRTPVLSASHAVTAQVEQLAGKGRTPILEFLPLYEQEHYGDLPPADTGCDILNIAFIGRIEADKGALDLITVADALRSMKVAVRFHVCGVGGAFDQMVAMSQEAGLGDHFVFHGWCDRSKLRQVLTLCQISIVPTRPEFMEGFNQVVIESVLAGRPPVASDACPAVAYAGDAVEVVQAGDLQGYVAAIAALARDKERLARRIAACAGIGRRFTDDGNSFGAALNEIFAAQREKRPVHGRRIAISESAP